MSMTFYIVITLSTHSTENEKNHTTIGSALLGIEPNMSNITPPTSTTSL